MTGDGGCIGSVFVAKGKAFGYLWHITVPKEECYHKVKVVVENPFAIFDCCTGCNTNNLYEVIVPVSAGMNDLFTYSQPSNL
jgi:hypothetical protein